MTDVVIELLNKVSNLGVVLLPDPPDLIIRSNDLLPSVLKERIRKYKAEILRHLQLDASMGRLKEANILIGISDDGDRLRIICSEPEADIAVLDGLTIWSPADMLHYIQLDDARERALLRAFKRRFGGNFEWKDR